jgi:hypothetical protein
MQELITNLMSQTNLDEAGAKKVITIVKNFLEDKLPSPIDDQVTKVLEGLDMDDVGDMLGKAKGLFGK